MAQTWYYLDPDNNKKAPAGLHCERCKRPIKETQSFESFSSIILHPFHPWFRMAKPAENGSVLIGSECLKKVISEYGEQF